MALFKKLLAGSGSSPFVDAVRSGDIASLQDENTKLDQVRDIEGRTLLHHAVETDSPDTLDLLISKGVEINQGDKDGWSPLHYAALFDRIECALIILASQGNIDVQTTSELWTPLHVAAWHGHIECARMLVEKGASVLIKDQMGRTARDIAVSSSITEVVEMLDKRAEFGLDYAMKAIESSTASSLSVVFLDACMQGLSEQAEYLLDSGAVHSYRDTSGVYPIHAAALNCEPHILTMLLDRGASITVQDDTGRTPLHWACQGGRKENMKILIEAGAEINPNFFPRSTSASSSGSETSPTASHHKSTVLSPAPNLEETPKVDRPKALQQRQTLSELQHRTTVTESGALPASLLPPSTNAIASPLHEACFSGSVECVEYLLECGADINSYCKGGGPLHFAAASKEDSGETLISLLKKGADPKLRNKLGQTALHIAAYYHNLDCVIRLLESNVCDVNAKDSNTATPIMRCIWGMVGKDEDKWAVSSESNSATESARGKAVLMTLIERGGDPSIAETGGVTPLHVASYHGLSDVVRILVNNGANPRAVDDHNATCLHKAVLNNHVKVAEILLSVNVDKDATDDELMTPLHFAVYGVTGLLSNLHCVQLLISRGAKIDVPNIYLQTALHAASSRGETELALLLVNNGANPNAQDRQGNTPLHRALAGGHADTAFGLIGWGFAHAISQNPNPKISAQFIATENGFKEYPLHAAVLSKNINAVEGILGLGASGNSVVKIDVDVQECYGNTPLHAASALGSLELVNSLLSNNASPHCANIEGATPLHIATLNGFVDIVYTLIKSGARVQDKDREGNTPIHYAAITGDELTMAELVKGIQSGVVDQKNNYSQTALHIAASLGHFSSVRVLVESGATLLKDGSGLTAADLSIDYPEIVQYLKKSRATTYKQKAK